MVVCHKFLHFVKSLEIFEDAIFEDSVELVFNACQNSCLFELIKTNIIHFRIPVQSVKINQSKLVQYLTYSRLNLRFIQELINSLCPITWNFHLYRVKPWVATFESMTIVMNFFSSTYLLGKCKSGITCNFYYDLSRANPVRLSILS